jgi:hypothetical protein
VSKTHNEWGVCVLLLFGVRYFQPSAKQQSSSTMLFYGRFFTTYISVLKRKNYLVLKNQNQTFFVVTIEQFQ